MAKSLRYHFMGVFHFIVKVALDEAAFLLDLASIDGAWADSLERIAECYKEAGLGEIARFILYND